MLGRPHTTQLAHARLASLGLVFLFGCQPAAFSPIEDSDDRRYRSDAGAQTSSSGAERCNGVDDDLDREVDEGCSCELGTSQSCYIGDPRKRGVGACRDGVQTCEQDTDEFSAWGPCLGAVPTAVEVPGNCSDEDCDGTASNAPSDCPGGTPMPDGSDTPDGDDLPFNDGDSEECLLRCVPGAVRYCDEPVFCAWGQQTCQPDARWGACAEVPAPSQCPPFIPGIAIYDPECCQRSGFCCQNFGANSNQPDDVSIGNCQNILPPACSN